MWARIVLFPSFITFISYIFCLISFKTSTCFPLYQIYPYHSFKYSYSHCVQLSLFLFPQGQRTMEHTKDGTRK